MIGKFLVLAGAGLLMAAAAPAQDWRLVDRSEQGADYLDAGRVTRRGEQVRFWHQIRYAETQRDNGPPYNLLTVNIRASCTENTYRVVEMIASLDGANEDRFRPPPSDLAAPDGSKMAEFIAMACTGRYREPPAPAPST
jgi:hypothetical protein